MYFVRVVAVFVALVVRGPSHTALAQQVGSPPVIAARVPTQRDVARMLRSADSVQRLEGLRMAQMLQPEFVSRDLRFGLFIALGREATAHRARLRALPVRGAGGRPVSRFHDELLTRVVSLSDSMMIPALATSLGTGMTPVRALVGFGRTASPAVLRIANDQLSEQEQVADGLLTLRLMIENPGTRPLSPAGRSQVRNSTLARLNAPGSRESLLRAIDLAIVLGDADLRAIVTALASSDAQVRQRGFTNQGDINKVKRHAHDRLRGLPAMPRT